MKHLALALCLLMVLSANTCKNSAGGAKGPLDTKWNLLSLAGKAIELPAGSERPWLQLSGDNLQGFGGCNQLMGSYKLEGTNLSFGNVGSTKKYCQEVQALESAVMGMLPQVDSFRLEKDLLKLMGGGKELAALQAAAE